MSISYSSEYYSNMYGSGSGVAGGIFAGMLIFFIIMMVVSIAISVLMIIGMWKIFTKNGKPGWYSLIPFFNMWTLFEIVGVQGWWIFVPFANIVYMYIVNYKLAIKMGKSQGIAILTMLVPPIGYMILAFSKSSTQGVQPTVQQPVMQQQPVIQQQPVAPAVSTTRTCSNCGSPLGDGQLFCANCGTKNE